MPKLQANKLRWIADLYLIEETVDDYDRPVVNRSKKRKLFYQDIGVTAQEKFLSMQAKTEIVRRIKIRLDRSITEKDFSVKIGETMYNIQRIYTDSDKREMELSLAYVD